jgi:hypothetical protein
MPTLAPVLRLLSMLGCEAFVGDEGYEIEVVWWLVDVVDGELDVDWVSERVFEIKPKLDKMVLLEKVVTETEGVVEIVGVVKVEEVTAANGFGSEGQHGCKSWNVSRVAKLTWYF